jgi:hypothetical protein
MNEIVLNPIQVVTVNNEYMKALRQTSDADLQFLRLVLREDHGQVGFKIFLEK